MEMHLTFNTSYSLYTYRRKMNIMIYVSHGYYLTFEKLRGTCRREIKVHWMHTADGHCTVTS